MPRLPADLAALRPPGLARLLPETQRAVHEWLHELVARRTAARPWFRAVEPAFPYQNLPPSARLSYELVNWANFGHYLPLFAADAPPYVDVRFKTRAALETYAVGLLTELHFSAKRGAADWLVRERTGGQPVGVLHLYELSCETYGSTPPPCCVGYALAAAHRRQGLGTEALAHLLTQATRLFGRTEARALSVADNVASRALLLKTGFAVLEERPATPRQVGTLLWGRLLP